MAKKVSKNKEEEEEVILTEEQMRKIDEYLLNDAKKYLWITLSAVLTAMIIWQIIGWFRL